MSGFIQSGRFGAAAFSPTDLAGLVLWLDASDAGSITESGGAVSQWNDLSGNGYHVSQATAGAKPGTNAATINGLNTLSFDGGDYLAATGTPSMAWKPSTAFVVAQIDDNATEKTFVSLGDGGHYQFRTSHTEHLQLLKSTVAQIGQATTANSSSVPSLSTVTYGSTGAYAFFTDGAANKTGTNDQTLNASTNLYVGNRRSAEYFLGDIAELLVYDTALGSTDRATVEAYLMTKWGV